MIPWVRCKSKLCNNRRTKLPDQRNVWKAIHLLSLYRCAQNLTEPILPDVYFCINIDVGRIYIISQPGARLNRSHCWQDAELLPSSEQTITQIFFEIITYPNHSVGGDSKDSPTVKREHFDVHIFAHTLSSGMDRNTVSSHYKHDRNTKYSLFRWISSGPWLRWLWSEY